MSNAVNMLLDNSIITFDNIQNALCGEGFLSVQKITKNLKKYEQKQRLECHVLYRLEDLFAAGLLDRRTIKLKRITKWEYKIK